MIPVQHTQWSRRHPQQALTLSSLKFGMESPSGKQYNECVTCDGEQQKAEKSLFLLDFLVTIVLIAVDIIAIVVGVSFPAWEIIMLLQLQDWPSYFSVSTCS